MSLIFQPQHVPKHFLSSKLPEPKGCNPSQKGHFSLPDANKHCYFPGLFCCLPSVLHVAFPPYFTSCNLWPQSFTPAHPPHLTPQCPISHGGTAFQSSQGLSCLLPAWGRTGNASHGTCLQSSTKPEPLPWLRACSAPRN